MVENGLYKIKDKYYSDFPHDKHIHNKAGRPLYYAVKDKCGIYWLIPISSQVDAYRQKIEAVERKRGAGNCLTFHIGIIAGQERVFKVCDLIPIADEYIEGEFKINGSHYIARDKKLVREIGEKARNYIRRFH